MRRLRGDSARPRLSVFRSNKQIYGQIIDDKEGKTIVQESSKNLSKKGMKKTEAAYLVGESLAKKAVAEKLKKVIFDKRSYKYHGRVKALADGARKGGLEL